MEPGIPRGEKREMCIFDNYVERYRIGDAGCGAPPRFGAMEGAGKPGSLHLAPRVTRV